MKAVSKNITKYFILTSIVFFITCCRQQKEKHNFVYNSERGLLENTETNNYYSEIPGANNFNKYLPPIGTSVEKVNKVYGIPYISSPPKSKQPVSIYYYHLIPDRVIMKIKYESGKVKSSSIIHCKLIYSCYPPISVELSQDKEKIYGEEFNQLSIDKQKEVINHDRNIKRKNWNELQKKYGNVIWK